MKIWNYDPNNPSGMAPFYANAIEHKHEVHGLYNLSEALDSSDTPDIFIINLPAEVDERGLAQIRDCVEKYKDSKFFVAGLNFCGNLLERTKKTLLGLENVKFIGAPGGMDRLGPVASELLALVSE